VTCGTPGGDRPVLVLIRDPVADRIEALVVGRSTGIMFPSDCVVNFDNLHTCRATLFVGESSDCRRRGFMRRVACYEPAPDAECSPMLVTDR
jgi:hypothetical protein